MSFELPYVQSTTKLVELFKKIPQIGEPKKADAAWLSGLGFASSNDRRFISVLKYLGMVDNSGSPTQLWRNYRGANARASLGTAIRSAYGDLYQTYPTAHSTDSNQLASLVKANTDWGQDAVARAISTFKAVCSLADLTPPSNGSDGNSDDSSTDGTNQSATDAGVEVAVGAAVRPPSTLRTMAGLTLNVNIQLTLPDTTDGAVYDALFASMKRHLLSTAIDDE